jgi:hypothetical protein
VLPLLLQGWGNLVNTAVLCILLAAFGQTSSKYNHNSLNAVWRISFGIGLIPVTTMLLYRLFFLQESKVWKRQNKPTAVRLPCVCRLLHDQALKPASCIHSDLFE